MLILSGTKQLVRWTQIYVPQPMFGLIPDDLIQILFRLMFGTASILAGYWFLKLNIKGFYLAISTAVVMLISYALSWNLWDPIVEKMVSVRRDFQGLPVREGEIEFMQALFPEGMMVASVISIFLMLITYKKFREA